MLPFLLALIPEQYMHTRARVRYMDGNSFHLMVQIPTEWASHLVRAGHAL